MRKHEVSKSQRMTGVTDGNCAIFNRRTWDLLSPLLTLDSKGGSRPGSHGDGAQAGEAAHRTQAARPVPKWGQGGRRTGEMRGGRCTSGRRKDF